MVGHAGWVSQAVEVDMKSTPRKRPKSREDHAWGVYGTFGYGTSKCSLEALRPVKVRVSKEQLHAWHVNTQGTHRIDCHAAMVHELVPWRPYC